MTALVIRCPLSPDIVQGTALPILSLKEMLASGEDITVIGSICGHTWKLSDLELKNLRNAAASVQSDHQLANAHVIALDSASIPLTPPLAYSFVHR